MNDGSASDSNKQAVLRAAEAEIANSFENAQEQGDSATLQAATEAKKDLDNIKQTWNREVTTDGSGNEVGLSGDFGNAKQDWKGVVRTNGDDHKIGISGKAGGSGDVEQEWGEGVTTKGKGNRVGIISR